MKVALVHNHYQQPGGEDMVFVNEGALLEDHGHEVPRYTAHNDQVANMGTLAAAKNAVWNQTAYKKLRSLMREERPSVIHFHNTLPLISPAAYYAAQAEGVPVVQTLHNYRLLCPNGLFFRNGSACEDCLGKSVPWPGVVHSCYRDSRPAAGVVAAMLTTHRALRTWADKVDIYIALTEFARQKFIEGGLPEGKVIVKPNFLDPDPGMGEGQGGYALFVGRLSKEKGVDTMLAAWEQLNEKIPLKVVGDGPLAGRVAEANKKLKGVEWLGRQPGERVQVLMKEARALVLPSECYEGFPMTIAEAYAVGLPVIASNHGSMSSLIEHGRTGLHFRPGDAKDLAAKVEWALAHPEKITRMQREARAKFEAKYTAERNYQMLMGAYKKAIAHGSSPK